MAESAEPKHGARRMGADRHQGSETEIKGEEPLIEDVKVDYDLDSKEYEDRSRKFKRLRFAGYAPPRVGTSLLAPARRSQSKAVIPRAPLKLRPSRAP